MWNINGGVFLCDEYVGVGIFSQFRIVPFYRQNGSIQPCNRVISNNEFITKMSFTHNYLFCWHNVTWNFLQPQSQPIRIIQWECKHTHFIFFVVIPITSWSATLSSHLNAFINKSYLNNNMMTHVLRACTWNCFDCFNKHDVTN